MPVKAMVYKTLSTVVDDFFSFVVKMPWCVYQIPSAVAQVRGGALTRRGLRWGVHRLHRLACFRDDVVFLILLYQRWIYRVDATRANEVRNMSSWRYSSTLLLQCNAL